MNKVQEMVARGAKVLVRECAAISPGESVLIVTDAPKSPVGEALFVAAKKFTTNVFLVSTKQVTNHGIEPGEDVARMMLKSDVILGVTHFSMAHTQARLNATIHGARYLSLPDYDFTQLMSDALVVDFKNSAAIGQSIKSFLDEGSKVYITTPSGTDVQLNISGRYANWCPGFCDKPGMLGSPPDIETNISPIEELSEGIVIVDGSIPCKELGLLKNLIKFEVKNGLVTNIDKASQEAALLDEIFSKEPLNARYLAEFGIGLNPRAQLCGRMLEDEGCLGTIHFGFGSNATVGGKNSVNFHLDFIIRHATVNVDGYEIMKDGNLLI